MSTLPEIPYKPTDLPLILAFFSKTKTIKIGYLLQKIGMSFFVFSLKKYIRETSTFGTVLPTQLSNNEARKSL
jgi:hypothetical protein